MVVLGGIGSLTGAVAGALFTIGLEEDGATVGTLEAVFGLLLLAVCCFRRAGWRRWLRGSPERAPGMNDALLQVRGLRKSYGALAVTDDVSLDVQAGQVHAIIGPNGAGKTTLLACRASWPRWGGVIYDGPITHLDMPGRVRRGLARSFQLTRILPQLSVLENVAPRSQARSGSSFTSGVPPPAALNDQAMECLSEVGLADKAQRPARLISHGEKRQLELAVALATGPRPAVAGRTAGGHRTGRARDAGRVAVAPAVARSR